MSTTNTSIPSHLSPEYRKAYNAGWRYSSGPCANGLDHGDDIGAPEAWYDGYLDVAAGRPKWTTAVGREVIDPVDDPAVSDVDYFLSQGWVVAK